MKLVLTSMKILNYHCLAHNFTLIIQCYSHKPLKTKHTLQPKIIQSQWQLISNEKNNAQQQLLNYNQNVNKPFIFSNCYTFDVHSTCHPYNNKLRIKFITLILFWRNIKLKIPYHTYIIYHCSLSTIYCDSYSLVPTSRFLIG